MNTTEFNYKEYLASREWAALRQQVRARSNGGCERCKVGKHESTHHVTYERVGREKLDDLLAVCNACHEFLSAKSDYDPVSNVIFLVVAVDSRNFARREADIPSIAAHQEYCLVDGILPQDPQWRAMASRLGAKV